MKYFEEIIKEYNDFDYENRKNKLKQQMRNLEDEHEKFNEKIDKKIDDECALIAVDIAKKYDEERKKEIKEIINKYFTKENGQIVLNENCKKELKNNIESMEEFLKQAKKGRVDAYDYISDGVWFGKGWFISRKLNGQYYEQHKNQYFLEDYIEDEIKFFEENKIWQWNIAIVIINKFNTINSELYKKRMKDLNTEKYINVMESSLNRIIDDVLVEKEQKKKDERNAQRRENYRQKKMWDEELKKEGKIK